MINIHTLSINLNIIKMFEFRYTFGIFRAPKSNCSVITQRNKKSQNTGQRGVKLCTMKFGGCFRGAFDTIQFTSRAKPNETKN